MSERFTEDGRRRITEGGVPLVRIIERNGVQWNAAISSETPSLARDAHIADAFAACWTVALTPYFSSSAETLDAHLTAHDWVQADRLREAVERLESERAAALAADQAARLDVEPDVVRAKLWMLQNDLYRLAGPRNDGWDEIQRAEAEAETMEAFEEKLEDMLPGVKWSRQSRESQLEIEARRANLDVLIRAEVDAAKATVQREWPDTPPQQEAINREIADALEHKGVRVDGKRIGLRRIEQARKGR